MDILSTLQEQSLLESFLRSDLDATFVSTITLLMAPVIDYSLMRDSSPWVQRGYAVLDDMISRGNMVAVQVKSEIQQLEDVFNYLPVEEEGISRNQQQSTSHGQFAEEDLAFQAPHTVLSPPMTHMGISPIIGDDLQLDEVFWQDGLTTEQLLNFANAMDISSLDVL
ncbi:hypothetical protein NW762_005647 [Fusarium torreyae]|uniref:Transcription factor n=1 Tax=Fusarium torreyae TaxID=1237075 RepID=A0A9W8S226_9HYPO|nr:hypothetical protein NW762_005647 [Fusarium torreyae]